MASVNTLILCIANSESQRAVQPVGPHFLTLKATAEGEGGGIARLLALLQDVLNRSEIEAGQIGWSCAEIDFGDAPTELRPVVSRAVGLAVTSLFSRDRYAPGTRLGPYEILERIGAGGMGEVYRALDSRLNRMVAIKRLRGDHASRFCQEARAIAGLNHPNICIVYDVGSDYLVMEYVEGKPLKGPLPLEDSLRAAVQVAGAVEAAHAAGVLHRDLKPDNVLVTSKGVIKLLDFGLAKLMPNAGTDMTRTVEGVVVGTAAYMSPEQAQGRELDERSDVFSFGALLYEAISGNRAFGGRSLLDTLNAVVHEEPCPLEVPPDIARIVTRCLRKLPANRFKSMAEVKRALQQCTAPVPGKSALQRRPAFRHRPDR